MKDKNTPKAKGLRTAYQAIAGMVMTYFVGLWAIPEVQQYTSAFVREQGVATLVVVLGAFGLGAGLISFIQNRLGR